MYQDMNGHTSLTPNTKIFKPDTQEFCEYKNLSNNSYPAGFIILRSCLPGVISSFQSY